VKNSPLHQKHSDLEAKMADFGGWLMPIEYPGSGVLAEHGAVRERVGLFDVSHLGKASVKGAGALEFLNTMFTNDLTRISDSKAQYTLLCNPDGGVVDDLIAYRNSDDDFFLIPNASNTTDVVRVLVENAPEGIHIENLHEKFAVLALQAPMRSMSSRVLESIRLWITWHSLMFQLPVTMLFSVARDIPANKDLNSFLSGTMHHSSGMHLS
jgi:glycine cleavage system aminomethyltransferase T